VDRVAETTSEVSGSSPQEQKHVAMLKGWDDETEGTDVCAGKYNANLRALQWSFCSLQPSTMYRNQFRAGFHRKKLALR
jgi:hypothetical protein